MATIFLLICTLSQNQKHGHSEKITVDVVELNTYGPCGFKQIILRQWGDNRHGKGHWITDWRTVVDCKAFDQRNGSVVRFTDSHGNEHEVTAKSYRETRTHQDVEVAERKLHPPENRNNQLE